jgi:hypothetical protein
MTEWPLWRNPSVRFGSIAVVRDRLQSAMTCHSHFFSNAVGRTDDVQPAQALHDARNKNPVEAGSVGVLRCRRFLAPAESETG